MKTKTTWIKKTVFKDQRRKSLKISNHINENGRLLNYFINFIIFFPANYMNIYNGFINLEFKCNRRLRMVIIDISCYKYL